MSGSAAKIWIGTFYFGLDLKLRPQIAHADDQILQNCHLGFGCRSICFSSACGYAAKAIDFSGGLPS